MATALVVAAFLLVGCQKDEAKTGDLPEPVAATRSSILAAVEDGDYEALRPLIKVEVFLSDYGFGRSQGDPVARWRKLGPKPLETMGVLLEMPHSVGETNEGTLYRWPRLDADSEPEDLTPDERQQLLKIMTEAELRDALTPDYGYIGPRVGILADGTWWFFLSGGAP